MIGKIGQQIVSFLSNFRNFFFYVLFFIIFGSAFLFLHQLLCKESVVCSFLLNANLKEIEINFTEGKTIIQFLVFSYIAGLMLFEFGRFFFKLAFFFQRKNRKKLENKKNGPRPNDIDIFVYLDNKRGLAKDVYVTQLFYSSTARLLLGFFVLSVIFYFSELLTLILGIVVIIILFWVNFSADSEVHNLGGQIKQVIKKND